MNKSTFENQYINEGIDNFDASKLQGIFANSSMHGYALTFQRFNLLSMGQEWKLPYQLISSPTPIHSCCKDNIDSRHPDIVQSVSEYRDLEATLVWWMLEGVHTSMLKL